MAEITFPPDYGDITPPCSNTEMEMGFAPSEAVNKAQELKAWQAMAQADPEIQATTPSIE